MGAALRSNRSLRRLLGAWLQSCVGTGLGYVALILLTVRHLHTSWAVAAVLLTDFLPSIVLGPWLGALADRHSKRGLIVTANLVQAGAWGALVFASSAPMILGFALLAGKGNALGRPAMRSALPIVAGESSQVAAAMYDTANWVGQTIGPAAGGGAVRALGGQAAACDQRWELRDRRGRDRDAADREALRRLTRMTGAPLARAFAPASQRRLPLLASR